MSEFQQDLSVPSAWKSYLPITLKFLGIFYLTTFCLIVFFLHRGNDWMVQGMVISVLYLFVLLVSFKQMISKLPMAAIFLAAPIIPLLMLILVVSMIPML